MVYNLIALSLLMEELTKIPGGSMLHMLQLGLGGPKNQKCSGWCQKSTSKRKAQSVTLG